jgi:transcriptional regulator with XRE-family HTH domain
MVNEPSVNCSIRWMLSRASNFGRNQLFVTTTNGVEDLQKDVKSHTNDIERKQPSDAQSFGLMMRALRERKRLSQTRLAAAAGFDHSYISRIEAGTRRPTREAVEKLADVLGLVDNERNAFFAAGGFLPQGVPFAHMLAAFWDAALIMNDPRIDQPLKQMLTSTVASTVAIINAYQKATNGRAFDIE